MKDRRAAYEAHGTGGLLDDRAAWRFVLDYRPGDAHPGHARPGDAANAAVPVRVGADGTWEGEAETTPEARQLLDLFLPLRVRADLVIGQLGQSLDGRIATEDGHSHYVTGPHDRVRLHRLRALVDAVVVGAGTIASDDPRLTVREVEGDCPTRVVLDPRGRLAPGSGVFTDGLAPTLWVTQEGMEERLRGRRVRGAEDSGSGAPGAPEVATGAVTEVVTLPVSREEGLFEPERILDMLRGRGLRRVLVEGGGVTVSRFLSAGALDRLHVTVAPLLLGSGRPSLTLPPIATLDHALRPSARSFRLGDDVLFDLDLRREG